MRRNPSTRPTLTALLTLCLALAATACGSSGSGKKQSPPPIPDLAYMYSWSTAEKLVGFSHSADLYATEPFAKSSRPHLFHRAKLPAFTYRYAGADNTIDDYFVAIKAAGLLVIKDGVILYERYAPGLDSRSLWQSFSVAKSVTSTLVGVALAEGKIHDIDDPVETYIPELAGSAYEGVTLRNMLRMASGVAWNEEYLDPASDTRAIRRCLEEATPDCILPYMAKLPRATDPRTGLPAVQGEVWNYSTGEAYLVGLLLQRATGETIGQYLQEKIWQPYGMEADGRWVLDVEGGDSVGGTGFNATLRDYGRFGQFVLENGVLPDGTRILPEGWVTDATTWTAASASADYADNGQYGYFWWFNPAYDDGMNDASPLGTATAADPQLTTAATVAPMTGTTADWTFSAIGTFGQLVAINPLEQLVVVQWGVWDLPDPVSLEADPRDPYNEEAVMINALTDALHHD